MLEIDENLGAKWTCFTPKGIRFASDDEMGRWLWKIANANPLWWERMGRKLRERSALRRWRKRSAKTRWFVYVAVPVVLIIGYGAERVPITGRWCLKFFPHSVLAWKSKKDGLKREELVRACGHFLFEQELPPSKLARAVLDRLVRAGGLQNIDWDLYVADTPGIANATVSLSGLVTIYSGILNIVKSEDELAALLSHEIAHVLANHEAEQRSALGIGITILAPFLPIAAIGVFFGVEEALLIGVPPVAIGSLLYLALSRNNESEADYIGLLLMPEAGYDPFAAVTLWRNMNADAEKREKELNALRARYPNEIIQVRDPWYMSTHPHPASRIEKSLKWAPKVLEITGRSDARVGSASK